MSRYAVVIEQAEGNLSAYVPDHGLSRSPPLRPARIRRRCYREAWRRRWPRR